MKSLRTKKKNGKKRAPSKTATTAPEANAPQDPLTLSVLSWVVDAHSGLNDARRLLALRDVHTRRGEHEEAREDVILVHEQFERVRHALIQIEEVSEVAS
jgi:hypothetical protein